MELNIKLVAFYSQKEIIIKDVEKDLYTKDRKIFHLFLFNNKNLHFKKSIIYNDTLVKEFDNVLPEFCFDKEKAEVAMIKKISDFDKKEFSKKVIENYKQYLKTINYRIDCIFQTFTLFNNLYKDKILIFIFPYELYKNFLKLMENNKIKNEILEESSMKTYINYYDIIYWINYFFKINSGQQQEDEIDDMNIRALIKII